MVKEDEAGRMYEGAGERITVRILERMRESANVQLAFGESRMVGDRTLLPVAMIAYGFGGGGGSAPSELDKAGPAGGSGSGGGGGLKVKPLGVLEVGGGKTRFIPVFDMTRLVMMTILSVALGMLVFRMRRK